VSYIKHSFNIKLAEQYGIEEAILLDNLGFWLLTNLKNGTNIFDGEVWTYNSSRAFSEIFPYMNSKKIQRSLSKLEELGILKSGNFNKLAFDHTKWYTIIDTEVRIMYGLENVSSIGQNVQSSAQIVPTIPDSKHTYINNNILSDKSDVTQKTRKRITWETVYNNQEEYKDIHSKFNELWELYGKVGSKKNAFKQWYKLTDEQKDKAYDNVPDYFSSLNDQKYKKHMERYISQELYLQEFTPVKKEQTKFNGFVTQQPVRRRNKLN